MRGMILKDGVVDKSKKDLGILFISDKDNTATVRLDYNGDDRKWLVTAFAKYK